MANKKINHLESTAFILAHASKSFGADIVSFWASTASKEDKKTIHKGVKKFLKSK